MSIDFAAAMRRALAETRALDTAKATAVIQEALGKAGLLNTARPAGGEGERAAHDGHHTAERRPLGAVVDALSRGKLGKLAGSMPRSKTSYTPPEAMVWESRTHQTAHGSRDYRLFVPAAERIKGLILMLHGCTQNAEDFAAGTAMNEVAAEHGLAVAWPTQTRQHNAQGCWNWFRPGDQGRAGEPAILAGIAESLSAELGLTPDRVFVAGLSAGGAMAAILAEAYPDRLAAIGIHSGLPTGRAGDVVSAFAAMRGETGAAVARASGLRTIVFHGAADGTVHPSNGLAIAEAHWAGLTLRRESGEANGRSYVRSVATGPRGLATAEHWLIEGAGHAWSGGTGKGSYADPAGPDASRQMVRFFLEGTA